MRVFYVQIAYILMIVIGNSVVTLWVFFVAVTWNTPLAWLGLIAVIVCNYFGLKGSYAVYRQIKEEEDDRREAVEVGMAIVSGGRKEDLR